MRCRSGYSNEPLPRLSTWSFQTWRALSRATSGATPPAHWSAVIAINKALVAEEYSGSLPMPRKLPHRLLQPRGADQDGQHDGDEN